MRGMSHEVRPGGVCSSVRIRQCAVTDRLAAVGARLAGSCESIALLIDFNGSDHYRRSATHRLSDTREAHLPFSACQGFAQRLEAKVACLHGPAAGRFKVSESKVTGLAFLHSNVLVRWVESSRRYFGGSRGSLAPPTGCSVRVRVLGLVRSSSVPSSNAKPRAGPLAWSAAAMGGHDGAAR